MRVLTHGGVPLLDGYELDEMAAFAQGQALVPWPNRLADGRYEFAGRSHRLALTEPASHNAIHGLTRWSNWRLGEHDASRAVLSLSLNPQAGYPFALALRTECALGVDGLPVRTAARNVDSGPAPYGAGIHPYLTVGADEFERARLQVPATTRLELDERGIPTERRLALDGGEHDFGTPRATGTRSGWAWRSRRCRPGRNDSRRWCGRRRGCARRQHCAAAVSREVCQ